MCLLSGLGTLPGRAGNGEDLEEDVRHERDRVRSIAPPDMWIQTEVPHPLVLRGLTKQYPARGASPAKLALDSLDLLVEHGECFGLLGGIREPSRA